METILNLFDDILKTLNENTYLYWVLGACLFALIVLVVILLSSKSANDDHEVNEKELIRQTLSEKDDDIVLADDPSTEVSEEEIIEEEVVVEEVVETEPVVEEVKVEEPKKAPTKKTTKKAAPVKEEVEKKPRVVYGKYEVYSDGTSFYYSLKASNGEVLIKSEAYPKKESVYMAIEAIKRNVEQGRISVRQDKHGLYQFVLIAKNHRTLVMSANYTTEKRAQSASLSFKRFAATSPVVEIEEILVSDKEEIIIENVVDKKGGKIGVVSSSEGFYYILKASNGEVLVHSNFYKTELSAEAAMKRFQETVFTGKFFVEKDKRNNYQFKLFSSNGRIICVGHIYATKALAIASANSVCSFVKLATPIENND